MKTPSRSIGISPSMEQDKFMLAACERGIAGHDAMLAVQLAIVEAANAERVHRLKAQYAERLATMIRDRDFYSRRVNQAA